MKQYRESRSPQSYTPTPGAVELPGRYVYCIAPARDEVDMEEAGIEDSRVYAVVHENLCAVVHDCPAQLYLSQDNDVVTAWVLAHHRIVNEAWKKWGTVLPIAFNTVVSEGEQSAEGNLRAWLFREYDVLKGRLEALTGKGEFGIQVFWDSAVIALKVAMASSEIQKIEEEIKAKPRGLAYMYRQKLERMLKGEMEARAAEEFKALFGSLSPLVDNIRVEKTKAAPKGRQMLANLSCLVSVEKVHHLEAELDQVNHREGFSARLVGPLPPYSFC